jgi:hypothetical protein
MDNYKKLLRDLILLSLTFGMILFPVQKSYGLDILKCLGAEELILHQKKLTGPLYLLNQQFISELSSWGKIRIKKDELYLICTSKDFSPSVNLLRHFLIYGKSFFKKYKVNDETTVSVRALQKSLLDALLLKVPSLFLNYLSSLQALSTNPHCLDVYIPEIKYFIYQFKYLENEISSKELLSDKQKIKNIFAKIKNLGAILKKCEKTSN